MCIGIAFSFVRYPRPRLWQFRLSEKTRQNRRPAFFCWLSPALLTTLTMLVRQERGKNFSRNTRAESGRKSAFLLLPPSIVFCKGESSRYLTSPRYTQKQPTFVYTYIYIQLLLSTYINYTLLLYLYIYFHLRCFQHPLQILQTSSSSFFLSTISIISV